ncbi:MAG: hypothetical protein KIT17_21985 [Rubrivivax sp.]|nr:hypothetical protein [Rubrivivax sp.]
MRTFASTVIALSLALALPVLAQEREAATPGASIAGKAAAQRSASKAAARTTDERRAREATTATKATTAGAAAAVTTPSASRSTSPATPEFTGKDKSHCHSRGGDA